jgi:uncharacterized protein
LALLTKISEVLKTDITKDLLTKEISFRKKTKSEGSAFDFVGGLKKHRSIMNLGRKINLDQEQLTKLIFEAVQTCPSAFTPSATRTILLLDKAHEQFWDIVIAQQKRVLSATIIESAELKIEQNRQALGTILFYEDQRTIYQLKKAKPLDGEAFPKLSEQNSGIAQFAAWSTLSQLGLGAHLQHYHDLNVSVAQHFAIDVSWQMKAQLVFGSIESETIIEDQQIAIEDFKIFT